jgi:diaminohydroxyphosphoribosylaminopyrimidine deaminase / 5-amino-6-(5-phosphoribosylamino)uracil reductase
MRRALELARKAEEGTRPNPRVGAVVVKGGRVVGEGFHRRAGEAHAEVKALQKAGVHAKGADLYVTLEPCSSHGRTPPCTDRIVAAGVREVIYGAGDVDRKNAGRADRILKRAKIGVTRGVLREACENINEDYRHWTTRKTPWVILKLGMTMDGYLAVPGKKWVTGEQARAEVQKLRAGCDAILVGAETVRTDDPRLTVRTKKVEVQPWRVVVTRSGKLPKGAKLFRDRHKARTLVYRRKKWSEVLQDLHRRGVSRLLVEGGLKTAESLLQHKKINELILHLSPLSGPGIGPRWRHVGHEIWRKVCFRRVGKDGELHFFR